MLLSFYCKEKKHKKYVFLLDKSYYECYPISCRGAFFISIPVDMSGIEETGRKEKTPKMERTMIRFFWVQVQYICNCHRKMESYLRILKEILSFFVFIGLALIADPFSFINGTVKKGRHKHILWDLYDNLLNTAYAEEWRKNYGNFYRCSNCNYYTNERR